MRGKLKWLIIAGLGGFVVLLLIGGVIALGQIPDMTQQLPPSATPLIVNVATPLNGSAVPLNALTSIQAEAIGAQSIAALELWIDGALVQAKTTPVEAKLKQVSASWTWAPGKEGEHSLFVRAVDAEQHVSTSNVVRVRATQDANNAAVVDYEPETNEPIETVAEKFNTTPQQILDLNPELNPNTTIPAGQSISVPVEPPALPPSVPDSSSPQPPSGPTDPSPGKFLNNGKFWINKNLLDGIFKPKPPAVPALAGKEEGCSVKLYVSDNAANEDGFFIYRADAISQNYKRIATLDAHGGNLPFVYVDSNVFGPLAYYVAAFNSAGESPSKYVQVEINTPACASPNWTAIQLQKGKLTTTEAVDKVYCYVSMNKGPWTRVPPTPNTFIYPKNGEFDVSQYITLLHPPQGTVSITLECWGWKGNTLVYLGEASGTFDAKGQETPIKMSSAKFLLEGNLGPAQVMGGPGQNPAIAPPRDLKDIPTSANCDIYVKDGLSQLLCAAALYKGDQVVHWLWWPTIGCFPGSDCPYTVADIDGYKIFKYSINNPLPELVQTINDPKQQIAVVPCQYAPENALVTDQYVVRAFKGPDVSADSNMLFVKRCSPKNVTLPVETMTFRYVSDVDRYWLPVCGVDSMGEGVPFEVPAGQVAVGYDHWYDKGAVCWKSVDHFFRSAVWFNTGKVTDQILSARLSYKYMGGYYNPGGEVATNQQFSCATTLMFGAEDWRGKDYGSGPVTIPGEDYLDLGLQSVKKYYDSVNKGWVFDPIQVDVTNAVKQWQQGTRPNYGFVLRGNDESDPKANNDCWSFYSDFKLDLVTIQKP